MKPVLSFYHVCADGAESKNFIICEDDYRTAFNLVGICAANCEVAVIAFSIEDTHPHFLLYGTRETCSVFKDMFESSYKRYLIASRGYLDGVQLNCQIIKINDEEHLKRAGTYVINQATKDGKKVMPFDYYWSSGPLYFRSVHAIPVWCVKMGKQLVPRKIGELSVRLRQSLFHSKRSIPDSWLFCNDIILPQNYVDVSSFERIYQTHNCYRAFLSSGRARDEAILMTIAQERGVILEDLEARELCGDMADYLFGVKDVKVLNGEQRLRLAMELRKQHKISRRQIATLVRLPLSEVEKYI